MGKIPRRIVQILTAGEDIREPGVFGDTVVRHIHLYALADDGTLWQSSSDGWKKCRSLPDRDIDG